MAPLATVRARARSALGAEVDGAAAVKPEGEALGLEERPVSLRLPVFAGCREPGRRSGCVAMPELAVQKVVVHPLVLLSVVDHFNR